MKTVWKHPGPLVKRLLKQHKIKQFEFAAHVHQLQSVVSNMTNGKRPLTFTMCVALEELGLGKALDWYLHQANYDFQQQLPSHGRSQPTRNRQE